jgi:hypothetical protein
MTNNICRQRAEDCLRRAGATTDGRERTAHVKQAREWLAVTDMEDDKVEPGRLDRKQPQSDES